MGSVADVTVLNRGGFLVGGILLSLVNIDSPGPVCRLHDHRGSSWLSPWPLAERWIHNRNISFKIKK